MFFSAVVVPSAGDERTFGVLAIDAQDWRVDDFGDGEGLGEHTCAGRKVRVFNDVAAQYVESLIEHLHAIKANFPLTSRHDDTRTSTRSRRL